MARLRKRSIASSYMRLGRLACGVCDTGILGNTLYVIVIGLIGTVVTLFELIRVINGKTGQARCPSRGTGPPEVERDLKLMTSILGIEHYTLIVLGAVTNYPMLHAPWLLMQLCVIAVELLVFVVRLFLEGLHVSRDEIFLSILTLHNWLQVFCLFQRQTQRYLI